MYKKKFEWVEVSYMYPRSAAFEDSSAVSRGGAYGEWWT